MIKNQNFKNYKKNNNLKKIKFKKKIITFFKIKTI